MTPRQFLARLATSGVTVTLEGPDILIIRAPRGVLTDDLKREIKTVKPALLAYLRLLEVERVLADPPYPGDKNLTLLLVQIERRLDVSNERARELVGAVRKGGLIIKGRKEWGPYSVPYAIPESVPRPPETGPCRVCKGTAFWISAHGVRICERCHPPADPGLVASTADPHTALVALRDCS